MKELQDSYKDTKIGRIPKDWNVMMLNEITNYKSSNLSLNKLEENTGKYKLYGASGMLKGVDFYQTDKDQRLAFQMIRYLGCIFEYFSWYISKDMNMMKDGEFYCMVLLSGLDFIQAFKIRLMQIADYKFLKFMKSSPF